MGIFIDIEDHELRNCLEKRYNARGNCTPVTGNVNAARVIIPSPKN